MKIYLLNPPFVPNFVRCGRWQGAAARSGGLDYPKWLAYATGILEKENHEVRLVDAPANKLSREDIILDATKFGPDLIVVDTNFSSLSNDIAVTGSLKEHNGANTILVGPPTSQFPDQILGNDGVDMVARFEYDFTLKELAEAINDGNEWEKTKGISYKKNGKIVHNPLRELTTSEDLDNMPFVSKVYKEHLNIKNYFLSQSLYPEVQIFAGRGCPNLCTFCSWPVTLMGRKYRARSPENIADEFEWIRNNLPEVREIFIEDDTFTIKKKLVREFCDELKRRGLDLTWSCNARADLDYETMRLMKKAGCRLIIVGYESGSDEILKNIKKGITVEQIKQFNRAAKKARLMVHADFIIGLPGETKETAQKTLDLIKELKPNILQVAVATPLPGTEFYEWVNKNNFLLVTNMEESIDKKGFQKCIISYPDFTNTDIDIYVDRILKEYYLNTAYIPIAASNIFRKNGLQEIKGLANSAKVFLKYLERSK
ncbi:MAG TPA: radical SAM protein [Proteobacteria bacterium]|nr:radical SAM protein [Pseudomonadota bacterium]